METRTIILESAFRLLKTHRFKDITVEDILKEARCSRYTFYRYFQDKYEIMHIYYADYVTRMLKEEYDGTNFEDIQARIFQFISDNQAYFRNVKELSGDGSFWDFLSRYTIRFFQTVRDLNRGGSTKDSLEALRMKYVMNGAVSVFRAYTENETADLSPKEVSRFLCQLYPAEYYILPKAKIDAFRRAYQKEE